MVRRHCLSWLSKSEIFGDFTWRMNGQPYFHSLSTILRIGIHVIPGNYARRWISISKMNPGSERRCHVVRVHVVSPTRNILIIQHTAPRDYNHSSYSNISFKLMCSITNHYTSLLFKYMREQYCNNICIIIYISHHHDKSSPLTATEISIIKVVQVNGEIILCYLFGIYNQWWMLFYW